MGKKWKELATSLRKEMTNVTLIGISENGIARLYRYAVFQLSHKLIAMGNEYGKASYVMGKKL
jgi:hypothetical protein